MTSNRKKRRATKKKQKEFAKRVAQVLRQHGVSSKIHYDPDTFSLELRDGGNLTLANAFDEYRHAPAYQRKHILARFASCYVDTLSLTIPESFEAAAGQLRADVKTLNQIELDRIHSTLNAQGRSHDIVHRPVGPDLAVCLVLDAPTFKCVLTEREVEKWGVDAASALQKAIENLADESPPAMFREASGYWVSQWHDDYDAARLVLPNVIRKATGIQEDLVAMLPNRNCLLIGDPSDTNALVGMATHAQLLVDAPRFKTGKAYIIVDNEWQAYLPQIGHPAYHLLNELAITTDIMHWNNQIDGLLGLQACNAATVPALPATAYSVSKPSMGRHCSIAILQVGVAAMIPDTDYVVLMEIDFGKQVERHYGMCPTDELIAALGSTADRMGLHPERIWARKPITKNHIAKLRLTTPEGDVMKTPDERPLSDEAKACIKHAEES